MNTPQTMTAIDFAIPGDAGVLETVRLPVPVTAEGEVLIRVAAAGVNGPDLAQRRGHYDPPPGASPILGLEVSGEIAALGKDAHGFALGDRVVALTNGGGYADYVAVPAGQVLPLPTNWGLVEGAALPETYFTIMQTLVMRAGLEPGHWVLVHGAAGGIGGAAMQIALILGARPIAVVSTPAKAAYAMRLGAAAVIDHTQEDIVERVLSITGGHGADRVIDMMGGPVTARNVDAAARGGHIVMLSALAGRSGPLPFGTLVQKQLTISGSTLRPQPAETKAAIAARLHRDIWPALGGRDWQKPQMHEFALAKAVQAHRAAEDRSSFGKILLVTAFGAATAP